MTNILQKFANVLDGLVLTKTQPWWAWPLFLFALAALCTIAALLVYPQGAHEQLWLFDFRFGGECAMKTQFGIPCPQCGMTRSWVWLVRGEIARAFTYNPAGALLFLWIFTGGVIGMVRLLLKRPQLWSPPWIALFSWCMFWILVPYMGLYVTRIAGWNILPEYTIDFQEPDLVLEDN